jgi:hypothetical protein
MMTTATTGSGTWVGRAMMRLEDEALLRGGPHQTRAAGSASDSAEGPALGESLWGRSRDFDWGD